MTIVGTGLRSPRTQRVFQRPPPPHILAGPRAVAACTRRSDCVVRSGNRSFFTDPRHGARSASGAGRRHTISPQAPPRPPPARRRRARHWGPPAPAPPRTPGAGPRTGRRLRLQRRCQRQRAPHTPPHTSQRLPGHRHRLSRSFVEPARAAPPRGSARVCMSCRCMSLSARVRGGCGACVGCHSPHPLRSARAPGGGGGANGRPRPVRGKATNRQSNATL